MIIVTVTVVCSCHTSFLTNNNTVIGNEMNRFPNYYSPYMKSFPSINLNILCRSLFFGALFVSCLFCWAICFPLWRYTLPPCQPTCPICHAWHGMANKKLFIGRRHVRLAAWLALPQSSHRPCDVGRVACTRHQKTRQNYN